MVACTFSPHISEPICKPIRIAFGQGDLPVYISTQDPTHMRLWPDSPLTGTPSPIARFTQPDDMQTDQSHQTDCKSEIFEDIDPKLLHPLFSSPEGDVILGAKGGTLFRVHSYTLKTTSGWFRDMFSLPQKLTPSAPAVLYLDEDAHTLEALFRMMCGLPILPLNSYDTVDSLLYATEKYDMPGPTSIIRHLLMTQPLADQPLRLYAVACRYGWAEEAKAASSETLKYNLHLPEHRTDLQRLGTTAILNLFELHRARRDGLKERLNQSPFVGGGSSLCVACGWKIDYHTWRELKYKIIMEMDARPLGDTVVNSGLADWEEAKACWRAKCANPGCDRTLYDRCETVRVIVECVTQLPIGV